MSIHGPVYSACVFQVYLIMMMVELQTSCYSLTQRKMLLLLTTVLSLTYGNKSALTMRSLLSISPKGVLGDRSPIESKLNLT